MDGVFYYYIAIRSSYLYRYRSTSAAALCRRIIRMILYYLPRVHYMNSPYFSAHCTVRHNYENSKFRYQT